MTSFTSLDPMAFRRGLKTLSPELADYAQNVTRLSEAVKARGRASIEAKAPAEKVKHLELAKVGLSELRACVRDVPTAEIVGLDSARDHIDRLEQTYRAFGYYRLAGVP